ncbi:MAG: AAA family ATPase [Nitrospirae bacterium]|nr:AAA family ATPase [Nitrospirota bacterium]
MLTKYTMKEEFVDEALEIALLKALTENPENYWNLLDLLPPGCFYRYQEEFKSIAKSIESEATCEMQINVEPHPEPVEAAKTLAALYKSRLLVDVAQRFMENLRDRKAFEEVVSEVETGVALAQQAVKELSAGQIVALPELLVTVLQEVQAKIQLISEKGPGAVIGIPSGISPLDSLLGGFQRGIIMLAAEPGKGKTTFLVQMCISAALNGFPAIFVSFEESLSNLGLKCICNVSKMDSKPYREGYGDIVKFEDAISKHAADLSLVHFIEGSGKLSIDQVRGKALQVISRCKTSKCLIVVDYLQAWASLYHGYEDYRHVISSFAGELRGLSKRLDSPVLVVSSQNRGGQNTSKLTSLKESGDLEYGADAALFLTDTTNTIFPITPPARGIELSVEKNRYGDKGKIALVFRPDFGLFMEPIDYSMLSTNIPNIFGR